MRLGQLVVNAIRLAQPCPEVFHAEDDAILLNEITRQIEFDVKMVSAEEFEAAWRQATA